MFLENYTENGDVTGRTVIGIVSGGVGCGNNPDKKPNYPKWWARVSKLKLGPFESLEASNCTTITTFEMPSCLLLFSCSLRALKTFQELLLHFRVYKVFCNNC